MKSSPTLRILIVLQTFFLAAGLARAQSEATAISPERAQAELVAFGEKIEVSPINELPLQQNVRIKHLDTLSRELMLFISGSYRKFGLDPVQLYISLVAYSHADSVEILEIRDVPLRTELGYLQNKKLYNLAELEKSPLSQLAEPLFKKQEETPRLLSEHEKNILETYQQMAVLKEIVTGQNIITAADFSILNQDHGQQMGEVGSNKELQQALGQYFQNLNLPAADQKQAAAKILTISRQQKTPELFQHYMDKIDTEIFYNRLRAFFWAALVSLFLGFSFLSPLFRNKVPKKIILALYSSPMILVAIGLALRIYITKFAPITNMYGTMIWVSFGITFFGLILYSLYNNHTIPAMTLIASGLMLTLTEQIPLILSPGLDPIVAVLRSNFWLSTHVTTITISYAAFTIAMVLGNIGLIRLWIYKDNSAYFKEYSHYAYRMIQLGCFLLSVGIILGGVWADYSWGRFWGWDPKETWALIADLGFLIILHGRFVGWITPFTLLAWSPLAYLLVIMAWYGVNFILAAGLHSYGFSSGGATIVGVFVTVQIILLAIGLLKLRELKLQSRE